MKIKLILFCMLSSTLSWCSEKDVQQVASMAASTQTITTHSIHQQTDHSAELFALQAVLTMSKEQDAVMKSMLEMIEKLSTRMRTIEESQKILKKRLDAVEADKKKDTV